MRVTCWAAGLGECSDIQSREHYISKGLFKGKSLKLQGLPWCKTTEAEIGLASASSKILCKLHNERLSILDDEAIRTFDCVRRIFALQAVQKQLPVQHWKVQRWTLNGRLLERWFLKTMVNLVMVQTADAVWPGSTVVRLPPKDVVAACFGAVPILSPRGLYAAGAVGQNVNSHDSVSFAPLTHLATQTLAGGVFEFRGLRFILAWTEHNLEMFIRRMAETVPAFAGWQDSSLLHPFKGMNFNVGDRRAQMIKIVWPPFTPERAP